MYTYVYVYTYICMYVCTYVRTYVCMYVLYTVKAMECMCSFVLACFYFKPVMGTNWGLYFEHRTLAGVQSRSPFMKLYGSVWIISLILFFWNDWIRSRNNVVQTYTNPCFTWCQMKFENIDVCGMQWVGWQAQMVLI